MVQWNSSGKCKMENSIWENLYPVARDVMTPRNCHHNKLSPSFCDGSDATFRTLKYALSCKEGVQNNLEFNLVGI